MNGAIAVREKLRSEFPKKTWVNNNISLLHRRLAVTLFYLLVCNLGHACGRHIYTGNLQFQQYISKTPSEKTDPCENNPPHLGLE